MTGSLEAAQAAMRLDPTLVPPVGSVITILSHEHWRGGAPADLVEWTRGEVYGTWLEWDGGEVFVNVDLLDQEYDRVVYSVAPEDLFVLERLPRKAPPMTEWLRRVPEEL